MKRLVLMVIPALICGIVFTSCNTNDTKEKSTLSFKAEIPTEIKSTITEELTLKYDTVMVFTGNDIAWYNDKTGELKFTDDFSSSCSNCFIMSSLADFPMKYHAAVNMLVFSDNDLLFSIKFNFGFENMSQFVIPPCFYVSSKGYFIIKSDPNWEGSEQNWKEIEKGWNKFIAQLKKEGKYRK